MWPFTASPSPSDPVQPSACPVDHSTREAWLAQNPSAPPHQHHSNPASPTAADPYAAQLSTEREVSSIPRWLPPSNTAADSPIASTSASAHPEAPPPACPMHADNVASSPSSPPPSSAADILPLNPAEQAAIDPSSSTSNWVYPSPASFYTALERKQRNPQARDMTTVVPIHNAVNERVWEQVLEWEREALGLREGEEVGTKLVSFVGKPREMSPRARWKSFIGYTAPFDRHDWLVDRPLPPPSSFSPSSSASSLSSPTSDEPTSLRVRYVIDFYTGRGSSLLAAPPPPPGGGGEVNPAEMFRPNLAFFIDCRPALDGWEGVKMRFNRYWGVGGEAGERK